MNQVADILDLAGIAQQQNIDAVLATVVRTEGSAYRHAGAMMLICADGRSVGMISGGCLEPHIIKRAFWLTRNGANVQVYQTGDEQKDYDNDENNANELDIDSDDELNFGLGCNGKVHVLFERLTSAKPLLTLITQVRKEQKSVTIATLIKFESSKHSNSEAQIGTRINIESYLSTDELVTINGEKNYSDSDNRFLNRTLLYAAKELSAHKFAKRNTEYIIVKDDLEQRAVQTEWLIQLIESQKRLLICGAGNDVMPLVTMAKLQDWHVTVIDSRPQYATCNRFPQADVVMCLSLDDTENLIKLSHNAAVAVMSHSLSQDRARLSILLKHAAHYQYLGQLGPRYRTERLIQEISATSDNPALLKEGVAKLHYPIGYKIGGDGPEALALSIMAQISAVINGQVQQSNGLDSKADLIATVRKSSTQLAQSPTEFTYINDCIKGYAHD